jgi:short-subunit dehydrogenase
MPSTRVKQRSVHQTELFMSNSTVVVVTGVPSGIGRATAEKFARQGCRVFGTLRRFMPSGPVDASLRKTFGLA